MVSEGDSSSSIEGLSKKEKEDLVDLVVSQIGVSKERAQAALEANDWDVVNAIMSACQHQCEGMKAWNMEPCCRALEVKGSI
mmetsp:Transcript_22992/g.58315  ORF Transcript_22992/g.58315 Transcript_22992/m.58315 type:complete len:82 (+) Transcript_22992:47-292(+)